MISKITGKKIPSHLLHLKDSITGRYITNTLDIANKIGETFERNSSSTNYSDEFQYTKRAAESRPLNFSTRDKHLPYNKKFKLRDLKRSIKKSKDTTPGPDNIHYRILKNLPDCTLTLLLNIINKHWDDQTFPDSWREAILLPIPKPGKDSTNPNNFRPIALTSCICKTVERMVNERLVHFLEKHNLLTKYQAGFRHERSTIDQLVRLDTYIRDAFVKNEHVVGVFFDLAKAYDTTWKYGIMKDLHTLGLRGNLPMFIQNFLSERTFQILLCTTLTPHKFSQEEGVPQGAILSTTLFNIKLNDIAKELTHGVQCSLYVDDFKIYFRSPCMDAIQRQLQLSINKVEKWTVKNGFTVSPNKTVAIHFCQYNSTDCKDPVLKLGDSVINFVTEHKFLGLIWDSKLTFHAHLQYLLNKCRKALNIIKVLSHSNWGSDTKTLLKLFRSLIRSKLDYGCTVYMNAKVDADLEALNVLHRQGIRLCLGAFKSSPIESLYVEANEPPLELRRKELAMRYTLKIKSNPNNPTYDSLFRFPYTEEYEYEKYPSLAESMRRLFEEAHVRTEKIARTKVPDTPIWQSEPNEVSFKLSQYDKSNTLASFFKSKFSSDILSEYEGYNLYYTDGSKLNELAAFGLYSRFRNISNRITDDSSIFTAEAEAIRKTLQMIQHSTQSMKNVIFCDSKSVLETISNQETRNPIMISILDSLEKLKRDNFVIEFCWIPSHVGIQGNERADQYAKAGLSSRVEPSHFKVPYTDFIPKVKTYIKNLWQIRYNDKHFNKRPIKLYDINPSIKPFYLNNISRKDEVIIHRLRIGHTRLTHCHLMENRPEPSCIFCDANVVLSVKHLLIDCLHFSIIRARYFNANSMRDLFERFSIKHIIQFLKEARLYYLI